MRIVTAAEMREMDRITIEDVGIAGVVLMESAGRAVAQAAQELQQEIGGGSVCVMCGKGNNGGDGFVVARYLDSWGIDVACVLGTPRSEITGDALTQLDIVDTLGIPILEYDDTSELCANALDMAVVFVDALLGTGLQSNVRPELETLIHLMNSAEIPIVAVDMPSGISADTGAVMGAAVRADITLTFGLSKRGLMVHPGCDYAGEIQVIDIGIPSDVVDHVSPSAMVLHDVGTPVLGDRDKNSHKGTYGHVLVVGGSPGKGGAALLAGMGALRAGAGLVTVLCDERCQASLEGRHLELMIEAGWGENGANVERLQALREKCDVVVVGPGLVADDVGREVLASLLANSGGPVVVDATGLALMAMHPELYEKTTSPLILTPHPGEAAALLGCTSTEVQANRFAALEALVEKTNAIVALKGARTLVGAPGEVVRINTTGNPGMATAGTGDVLSGIVGAFVLRNLSFIDAAAIAVYVHGIAGDIAVSERGQDTLIASDLLNTLNHALTGHSQSS